MKKFLCAAMVVALSAAVLSGCANNAEKVPETSAPSESPAAESQAPSPEPTVDPAASEELEMIIENLEISGGDHTIPAVLTLPAGASADQKYPAVLMLHGTASNKDEAGNGYQDLAPLMAEQGIATLRIDFMGLGDSTADSADFSNSTAVADANAAYEFLATKDGIDSGRIGVMGWSQGGTDALLVAADNSGFQSVLTWAGATDLTSILTPEMREEAAANGFAIMTFDWREDLKLGQKWIDEVDSTDVLAETAKITAPILAIAGTADTVVLPEVADAILAAAQNDLSATHLIEGADHTFNLFTEDRSAYEELCETTISWFKATL